MLVPPLAPYRVAVAEACLAVTAIVLLRGTRESDRAQRATSLVKALVLLALVGACVVWRIVGGTVPATVQPGPPPHGMALAAALMVALQGIIFAYDGWTGVAYFAGEVRDPGREIPRALIGGLLSTVALYLLLNAAFLIVLPLDALAASPLAAVSVATAVFGSRGGLLVQLLIAVALPSAIVANTLCASRVAFALGGDRLAPSAFARVNSGGTPSAALVASLIVAALALLSGTFERLIAICAFLFVASYALSFTSVFVLRRREPHVARPYRAWGHPWTTGIVLLGSIAFLVQTVAADLRGGIVVAGLLIASYPAFRVVTRFRS